jgi:hypothetical protein
VLPIRYEVPGGTRVTKSPRRAKYPFEIALMQEISDFCDSARDQSPTHWLRISRHKMWMAPFIIPREVQTSVSVPVSLSAVAGGARSVPAFGGQSQSRASNL